MNDPAATRAAGVAELRAMTAALLRHASPGRARIRTGPHRASYEPVCDELQGYARPLWGMAALAQSGDGAALGADTWHAWRQGLLHGTDPAHPEYWGPAADFSQAFCEMPPIALSLLWAGDTFWHPLSAAQRARVAAWLDQINHRQLNPNNWLWFRVLVNAVFFRLGLPHRRDRLEEDIAALESMAGDDGWYLDGLPPGKRTADLYIPSAFHVYALIAAELLAPLFPGHSQRWRARAARFALSWRWFQTRDGAPLLWGRSLCYRSCGAAFWSACAWAGAEALPWPEMAGLWRAQMSWWRARDTTRADGCLSLGYGYPNETICENYISHTSPYWQTKAWLALRHPADHPFWSSPSAPPPTPPAALALQTCGGLLLPHPDHPLLLLVGQYGASWLDSEGARYGRFAYDARHGFQITPGAPSPDNALLVRRADGGSAWTTRRHPEAWTVDEQTCAVTWSPLDGVRVTTTLRPFSAQNQRGHTRVHRISTRRAIEVLEGGFACPPGAATLEPRHAAIRTGGLHSAITVEDSRAASFFEPAPGANTLHPRVLIPVASGTLPPGEHLLTTRVIHHPA